MIINTESISNRLRLARKASGYKSARLFSNKNKISVTTYIQHENGKNNFSIEYAILYCDLLNINIEWLLTGKGPIVKTDISKDKQQLLYDSFTKLTKKPIQQYFYFDVDKQYQVIDSNLLMTILKKALNLVLEKKIFIQSDELITFMIHVYNNVVNASNDFLMQNKMIDLSISSIERWSPSTK